MKKTLPIFIVSFLLFIYQPVNVSALDFSQIENVILLNTTIEDINTEDPAMQTYYMQEEKFLLINGAISAITVSADDGYQVMLDVITAEWKNQESILVSKCLILLNGDQYKDVFPLRASRNPPETIIPLNSRVIILARVIDYFEEDGKWIPVLEGNYLRSVE